MGMGGIPGKVWDSGSWECLAMMGWLAPGRSWDGDEGIVQAGDQLGFPASFLPSLKIGKLISLEEWIESSREELNRGARKASADQKLRCARGPPVAGHWGQRFEEPLFCLVILRIEPRASRNARQVFYY